MEFRRYNSILRAWLPLLLVAPVGAAAVSWLYITQAFNTVNPWLFSVAVGLCALLWGVLGVFGIEYLIDNVRVWDDIYRITSAPLLGSIQVKHNPKNPFEPGGQNAAAEYQRASTRLLTGDVSRGRTILVSSPQPTPYTARVAANLGLVYAREGLPTLLVDADRVSGTLTKSLDLAGVPGFADVVLRSTNDVLLHVVPEVPNLQVLPSGVNLQVEPLTFSRSSLGRVLAEVSALRSLVLLVGPPVSASSIMSLGLAKAAEDIVLVVVAGESKRKALRQTVNALVEAGTNLVGIIFVKPAPLLVRADRARATATRRGKLRPTPGAVGAPDPQSASVHPVVNSSFGSPPATPSQQTTFASQPEGIRSGRFTERVTFPRPQPQERSAPDFTGGVAPVSPPDEEPEKPVSNGPSLSPEPDLSGLEELSGADAVPEDAEAPHPLLYLSELDSLGVELAEDSARKKAPVPAPDTSRLSKQISSPKAAAPVRDDTILNDEFAPQPSIPAADPTMPIPYVVNAPKFTHAPAAHTHAPSAEIAQAPRPNSVLENKVAQDVAALPDLSQPVLLDETMLMPKIDILDRPEGLAAVTTVSEAPAVLPADVHDDDDALVAEEALNDMTAAFAVDLPPRSRPKEQPPAQPVLDVPRDNLGASVSLQRTQERTEQTAPPTVEKPRGPGPVDKFLAALIRWWFAVRTAPVLHSTYWRKLGTNARTASQRVRERVQLRGAYLVSSAAVRRRRQRQLRALEAARANEKQLLLAAPKPGWSLTDTDGVSGDDLIQLLLAAAERARLAGDSSEAKNLINRVLDRDPRNETAWNMRLLLSGPGAGGSEDRVEKRRPVRMQARRSRGRVLASLVALVVAAALAGALLMYRPALSRFASGVASWYGQAVGTPAVGGSSGGVATHAPAPPTTAPGASYDVGGDFLQFWGANGGPRLLGKPISPRMSELDAQGASVEVQYFERARMELRPGSGVTLARIGTEVPVSGTVANPLPEGLQGEGRTFPETGNTVPPLFNAFWKANNGIVLFGLPVTPVLNDVMPDGKPVSVQYFERARFEYHPELADKGGAVTLTDLGVLDYAVRHPER